MGNLEQMLETHQQLPARCKVHVLSGDRRGVMRAKIEPDWILLYKIANGELRLFATGTHSDLFGGFYADHAPGVMPLSAISRSYVSRRPDIQRASTPI